MSGSTVWYIGAPLVALLLALVAVRLRGRSAKVSFAGAPRREQELVLGEGLLRARTPGAETSTLLANRRRSPAKRIATAVRATVARGRERVDSLRARPDVLGAVHAEGVDAPVEDSEATAAAARPDDVGAEPGCTFDHDSSGAALTSAAVARDRMEALIETAAPVVGEANSHEAGAFVSDDGTGDAESGGFLSVSDVEGEAPRDEGWTAAVQERETAARAAFAEKAAAEAAKAAREAAEREAERVVAEQVELERIAVAEEARVRAEARSRRWFVRLDPDLDHPSVRERIALALSIGIAAPWAGRMLREAFEQEDSADVRGRIIGALVSGGHLDVVEPFVTAFGHAGVERAATWEALRPYRDAAPWIAELLDSVIPESAAAA